MGESHQVHSDAKSAAPPNVACDTALAETVPAVTKGLILPIDLEARSMSI